MLTIEESDYCEIDSMICQGWFGKNKVDVESIRFIHSVKAKAIWRFLRDTDFTFKYENNETNPWVSASRDKPQYLLRFQDWLKTHVSAWDAEYIVIKGMELGAVMTLQKFFELWPDITLEPTKDIRIVPFSCSDIVFILANGVAKFGSKKNG